MSVHVMSWVWRHGPSSGTERLVLLAIADHADDEGNAFPSVAGIAAKSCMTERGTRGVLRRLEEGGWLATEVGGGRGGKSRYRVIMAENPAPETRNDVPGKSGARPETRKLTAANPEADGGKPGTTVPPNHQEPSENHHGDDARATVIALHGEVITPPTWRERILELLGVRHGDVTPSGGMLGGRADMAEAARWRDELGLTEAEVLTVVGEVMARKRDGPPKSFRYFRPAMQRAAAEKSEGPMRPEANHRRGGQPDDSDRIDTWLAELDARRVDG